jgi:hypothetical protein
MLFCALSTLTFVSCKKDTSNKESFIGKWDVLSERYTNYENNVLKFDDAYNNSPGDFVLEIFEDGTGKFYELNVVSSSFTWKATADENIFVINSSQTSNKVKLTVNGETLTWEMTVTYSYGGIEYKSVDYKECTRIK